MVGTVYNRIVFAMFFYFAIIEILVASKILELTTHKQVIKKKFCKCGSFALIITKKRFALNCADAVEVKLLS